MHISYRWLARHVDLTGISPERVVEDLTLSTAEVEGLERFLPHLASVVVGEVVERDKHPDAEKLSYCKVDVGGPELLGIVCGAPNVARGQKVAVATIGTSLPGDVKIKKSKIRGVESCGMICSERELGLGDEHAGIWVLPEEARIGKPVAQELGLDDWIIEIDNKSLTHRPDLWGHRGFAAEIAAMHRRALKPIARELPSTGNAKRFPVRVETPGCSRYVAFPIDGVQPKRSPGWLRALLLAVGQRPIDLLVDLSNFVMLDLGQPNHVFDRARLSSEGLVIRNARRGETMKTLDGVERSLVETDMLICDGAVPVALAGVMGGEGTKVDPATRSLLLEVAAFHPATVRRTAQRLALRTDASARFEKSLSPTLAMDAAAHFAHLLKEIEPAASFPAPVSDEGAWRDPARTIELRGDRVRTLLGADLTDAAIGDILTRLGFGVRAAAAGKMAVDVPSARATKDITIEQDLVEEVGRIHRYGNIAEKKLVSEIAPPPRDAAYQRRMLVRRVQDRLSGAARFHETLSYSFVDDGTLEKLGLVGRPHVAVVNPVAEGASRIRRDVMPSLLSVLAFNRRQREEVKLYEIGKGYLPEHSNERGEPREVHQAALVWATPPLANDARFDASRAAHVHGVIDDVVRASGRAPLSWTACERSQAPAWAHPGRCLVGRFAPEGAAVAVIAALEPGLAKKLGLAGELASDVACAEVSIDELLAGPERIAGYAPIPKFPGVKVDVAVSIEAAKEAGSVASAIEKAGKGLVGGIELFDVYSGPNLGAGKKSLAFHVTLQSSSRTLTDQDVHKFLERVEREVRELGGELRRE